MSSSPFLPLPAGLEIATVETIEDQVVVHVISTRATSLCPICFSPSSRLHSRYMRTVADMPCAGFRVRLLLHVRKFFCSTADCPRRIFTERLPAFVQPWARLSNRLVQALQILSLATSAEVVERIAPHVGMHASGPSLVRLLRALPDPPVHHMQVVGLDDWSLRKGQSYGSVFVDLESSRPVEVVADRTAAAVLPWMMSHQEVKIVTRDRAGAYADAISQALPHAQQVADQFHLIENLRDYVQQFLERKCAELPLIEPEQTPCSVPTSPVSASAAMSLDLSVLTYKEQKKMVKRQKRLTRYEEVIALRRTGMKLGAIAQQLHLGVGMVSRFVQSQGFPERVQRAGRQQSSQFMPYFPWVQRRWQEGCRDPWSMFEELQTQGYTGPAVVIARLFEQWQTGTSGGHASHKGRPHRLQAATPPRRLTSRQASFLMISSLQKRTKRQKRWIKQLCQDKELHQVFLLSQQFVKSLNARKSEALKNWLKRANKSTSTELRTFAKGLARDAAAVQAAFSLPWSNGKVEGHINRLKLIKRQMFGRAHIDLLRIKVLHEV